MPRTRGVWALFDYLQLLYIYANVWRSIYVCLTFFAVLDYHAETLYWLVEHISISNDHYSDKQISAHWYLLFLSPSRSTRSRAKVSRVKCLPCRLDETVESYHVIHLQNHRSGNKKDRASNVEELHSNVFLNNFLILPRKVQRAYGLISLYM